MLTPARVHSKFLINPISINNMLKSESRREYGFSVVNMQIATDDTLKKMLWVQRIGTHNIFSVFLIY